MPPPPAAAGLTEQLALDIGGWDTRYAQVLLIALDGNVGISIIDPNSDGNITEVEHVYLDPAGRWHAGSSSGGGTPDRYDLVWRLTRTDTAWRLRHIPRLLVPRRRHQRNRLNLYPAGRIA